MATQDAAAVATRVMGWEARDGWWTRHNWPTGLRVATEEGHRENEGYFRPDRSLFQLGLIEFRLFALCGATHTFRFPSGHVESAFRDVSGEWEASAKEEREDIDLDPHADKEAGCAAALTFIEAWREEHPNG